MLRAWQMQGTQAKSGEAIDYRTRFRSGSYEYMDPALAVDPRGSKRGK